jgi:hypothetical protein
VSGRERDVWYVVMNRVEYDDADTVRILEARGPREAAWLAALEHWRVAGTRPRRTIYTTAVIRAGAERPEITTEEPTYWQGA